MGAIRNLNKEEFDFLIGILFDEDYSVLKAVKIPHATIKDHARYRSHQNAHILHLNPKLLANSQVEDLAGKFADATSILVQT